MTLELGTRVRVLTNPVREGFRRYWYSSPSIQLIPKGATGIISAIHMHEDGELRYDVKLETVDTKVNKTKRSGVEPVGDDVPPTGEIVQVNDDAVTHDLYALQDLYMSRHPDIFSHFENTTDIYQNDEGVWCLRWNDEYQAIVDEMKGRVTDAS